jgi:hypothetical protein
MPATGTCFVEAYKLASKLGDDKNIRLVHGYVTSSRTDGLRYRHSHAWVEDISSQEVLEFSNGNEIVCSREKFYEKFMIEQTVAYSPTDAALEMLKHNHSGPWVEWLNPGDQPI